MKVMRAKGRRLCLPALALALASFAALTAISVPGAAQAKPPASEPLHPLCSPRCVRRRFGLERRDGETPETRL
jgi:hypothetical protein